MTNFLFVQGLDPIMLADDETFNKVRGRGNQALTGTNHKGDKDESSRTKPLHKLSFKTLNEDGTTGRIAINPEKFIGVGSDEERDEVGESDDE